MGTSDRFCAHCGGPQTGAGTSAPPPPSDPTATQPIGAAPPPSGATARGPQTKPHVAAMLCYIPVVGWLAAIFFLISDDYRRNRFVHFHALQALYLWAAYWVVRICFGFTSNLFFEPWTMHFGSNPLIASLRVAVIVIQIVGIVKTVKGEQFHLPIVGELAERSMV
jgi:uncharacterized membrane protein